MKVIRFIDTVGRKGEYVNDNIRQKRLGPYGPELIWHFGT